MAWHGLDVWGCSLWHRALGSRLESAVLDSAVLADLEIRVVSFDRPGYGQSSPHANRSIATFVGAPSLCPDMDPGYSNWLPQLK